MDKKVFRIGQLVYIVMSSELYGLEVLGVSIIPVTIATQLSKDRYAVKLTSLGESIILPMDSNSIFSNLSEANEEQMNRLNIITADMKAGNNKGWYQSIADTLTQKGVSMHEKIEEELDSAIAFRQSDREMEELESKLSTSIPDPILKSSNIDERR